MTALHARLLAATCDESPIDREQHAANVARVVTEARGRYERARGSRYGALIFTRNTTEPAAHFSPRRAAGSDRGGL